MKIRFTVPTKWDELTPWQVDRIGRMLYKKTELESDLSKKILLIILLLPKPGVWPVLKLSYLLTRISLISLFDYTDFLFDREELLTTFPEAFTVKTGLNKRVKLFGPAARLSNINITELSYADTFFYKWLTEDKDADLHRLCAVLYRPADPEGKPEDVRRPFNKLLLYENANLTDKIPLHQKYMIALAYQGTRKIFSRRYPQVFPAPKEGEAEKQPAKHRPYSPLSKIVDAMALDEVQPFGSLDKTEVANADRFLGIYNEQLIRQKEEHKRLEKSKRKNGN